MTGAWELTWEELVDAGQGDVLRGLGRGRHGGEREGRERDGGGQVIRAMGGREGGRLK